MIGEDSGEFKLNCDSVTEKVIMGQDNYGNLKCPLVAILIWDQGAWSVLVMRISDRLI